MRIIPQPGDLLVSVHKAEGVGHDLQAVLAQRAKPVPGVDGHRAQNLTQRARPAAPHLRTNTQDISKGGKTGSSQRKKSWRAFPSSLFVHVCNAYQQTIADPALHFGRVSNMQLSPVYPRINE